MRTRVGKVIAAAATGFVAVVFIATPGAAKTNLLYILDASNSMWGHVGKQTKIDTAKSVLQGSLSSLPKGVTPALMVYGHRQKNDCGDVQLVAPFGSTSPKAIAGLVKNITPRGKTPIAAALKQAGRAFEDRLEENNSVLLISDGIETCGGDPCAVAAELTRRGINLRVNVVGFDVDAKARAQLQCIARAGKGQYFDARNANDFKVAVAEVQKQVEKPAPPPPPPPAPKKPELYFSDDFDGGNLAPHWKVINPDESNYLVEDGVLTIVAADGTSLAQPAGPNILKLEKPVPKGDWQITARVLMEPRYLGEAFRIGIGREDGRGIYSSVFFNTYNYARTDLTLVGEKIAGAKGKNARFDRMVYYVEGRNLQARAAFFARNIAAIQLRLTRKGRKYIASVRLEPRPGAKAPPNGKWIEVQKLSSLKTPGDAFYMSFGGSASDYLPDNGEGVVQIDWVRIERP